MKRYTCILVEDDSLAIEMMEDYISRKDELILEGIGSELSEVRKLVEQLTPSIIFLDLIIPPGESKGFHWGKLPQSSYIVLISAIPLFLYKGPLPKGPIFELPKPISYENFNRCVEKILIILNQETCAKPKTF